MLGQCQHRDHLLTHRVMPSTACILFGLWLKLRHDMVTVAQLGAGSTLQQRSHMRPAALACAGASMHVWGIRFVMGGGHLDDEHFAVQRQAVIRQDAQQLPLRD